METYLAYKRDSPIGWEGFIRWPMALAYPYQLIMQYSLSPIEYQATCSLLPFLPGVSSYLYLVWCYWRGSSLFFSSINVSTSKEVLPSLYRHIYGTFGPNSTRAGFYKDTSTTFKGPLSWDYPWWNSHTHSTSQTWNHLLRSHWTIHHPIQSRKSIYSGCLRCRLELYFCRAYAFSVCSPNR